MNVSTSVERIDLNLFRVFDAIYRAGSLTRAAGQLHLTQPAISNALARLRERFGDPLFVRSGRRISPTPRAREIAPEVEAALSSLRRALAGGSGFDAAVSQRRFVIGMRDVLEFVLLPGLGGGLLREAPGLRLQSARIERRSLEQDLAAGVLDLAIDVPNPVSAAVQHTPLFEETLCVAMRADHALAGRRLSLKSWLAVPQVVVSSRRNGPVLEELELQRLGLKREVRVRCQHYYAACHLVAASDLMLVLPRYYGEWFARYLPLRLATLPVPLPGMSVLMYWHQHAEHDAGHRWLRERIRALFARGALRPA